MNLLSHRIARATAMIVAAGAVAYAAGDGNISVVVVDPSGQPVVGATVSISSPTHIGGVRNELTDAQGKARFLRLTPGRFKVWVNAKDFQSLTIDKVEVLVDQTQAVNAKLAKVGGAVVEVVSAAASVDVTTITAGTQLTQEELTSLPVARNQLATITLAPGVISLGGGSGGAGNPSLAAGLNRDNFGGNGARNNTYMLDGIDITSPNAGTYRTSIAQELVSTQDVKTGAITAEYTARAGLFSNVTTISGSNEFHGGLIAFTRSSSFWSEVGRYRPYVVPSKLQDDGIFLSGPIIKDKLWFVASFQKVKEDGIAKVDPTATLTPGETRSTTLTDETRTFMKFTWAIAPGHTAVAGFSRNPGTFDNLNNPFTVTSQGTQTERGGNNYNLSYTWQDSKFILDARYLRHEEADTTKALYSNLGPQALVQTDSAAGTVPIVQRTFGNSPAGTSIKYQTDNARVDFTYLFDAMGSHTLKAGLTQGKSMLTQTTFISGGVWYDNLGPLGNVAANGGPSFAYVDSGKYSPSLVAGNGQRLLTAINNQSPYASVKSLLDTNHDGTVSLDELGAYRFNELFSASNPAMGYYGYRRALASEASSSPKSKTTGGYLQDQWQMGNWSFTPGLRFDSYEYLADNGQSLFKTPYALAPRIGLTWDVNGDGRTKGYAYWGRYIDPIRLNMVSFTGSLTSSVQTEDVRIGGMWVTHNTRGGSKTVDAVFADSFKLPKTDEFRMGLAHDFGNNWSVEAVYTYRKDFDIVEDWDPTLYTSANALEDEARSVFALGKRADVPYANLSSAGKKAVDAYRSLLIPFSYFAGGGFSGEQNTARVDGGTLNFVLANLPGAYRVYNTFDLTVTRKFADHWGAFATYTRSRNTGNTNSSGDADYQGDLARFDPRLPYHNGALEGSVDWVAKGYLYYKWDTGFTAGLTYNVIGGYHYSNTQVLSRRWLLATPTLDKFDTEALGTNMSPRYDIMDAHFQYDFKAWNKTKGAVILDVFNFFNKQQATDLAPLPNVPTGFSQGQAFAYVSPRRYNIGFKLTF